MHFISKSKKLNANGIATIHEINESKEIENHQNFQDSPFGRKNANSSYQNDINYTKDQIAQINFAAIQKQKSTVNTTVNEFYRNLPKNSHKQMEKTQASKKKYNSYQDALSHNTNQEDMYNQTQTKTKSNSNSFNKFKQQFFSTNISEDSPHFNHILTSSKNKYQNTSDVKKKLFETSQSNSNDLLALYKTNLQSYEKEFTSTIVEGLNKHTQGKKKLSFQSLNLNDDFSSLPKQDQNNPNRINQDLSDVRKKLAFQTPKTIMQEIKKEALLLKNTLNTSEKKRNPQKQIMKSLIKQNRQSIRQLYLLDSKNVQYEYRKSKFMSLFLGKQSENMKGHQ